jgi:hypothetical protein
MPSLDKNSLLGLLAEGPKHGYELKMAFDEAIGGGDSTGVKGRRIDFGGKMAYNGGRSAVRDERDRCTY